MSNHPVLIIRVLGKYRAQELADYLHGYRMTPPAKPSSWWTIKVRDEQEYVQWLAIILGLRFTLKCCRCNECARQIVSGNDCMTVR